MGYSILWFPHTRNLRIRGTKVESVEHPVKCKGFTLIELLVATTILLIIVMISVQLFSKARSAWDTGARIADAGLKGRSVADFIAQEISQAVLPTNGTPLFELARVRFQVLQQVTNVSEQVIVDQEISFSAGTALFGTNQLCQRLDDLWFATDPNYVAGSPQLPLYVDVNVKIITDDGSVTNFYQSRASFPNRNRYKF
jgi:prepilin-type N-terminal cleavage/methylation domain-containing protein